jgi:glycosyltransferase involved in cell wall biosynthesis
LLVLSDDPKNFAEKIYRLLTNEAEWQQFAQAGRQFVNKHFDWQKTIVNLNNFLDNLVQ